MIDIILKTIPMPMRMMQLSKKAEGVLGSIYADIPMASIPPWKLYLKGDMYMIG